MFFKLLLLCGGAFSTVSEIRHRVQIRDFAGLMDTIGGDCGCGELC